MMKKTALSLLMLLCSTLTLLAENYPYRNDFMWVTVPNHANWLYSVGEKASIDVQLLEYGVPVDTEVQYSIAPDMLEPTSKGSCKLKNGRATISMGKLAKPGFLDMKLTATVNGKKTEHHVKVGFGVDKIQPYTQEPKDFWQFWQDGVKEMRKLPLRYERELAKEYCTEKIDCWLIKLQIDRKHWMYAYLTIPKNAKQGQHAAVLCPPGAGVKTIKEPLRHKYYAEDGFIRMEAEIHGLDPRLSTETFSEITNAFGQGDNGYLNNGLDSRDRYYMRHVYLGMVRCMDFLCSLPEWDGKNLITQGGSQGGALSMVAAALDNRVTQCVSNHPALTDMAGYAESGRTGGYPHFNRTEGLLNKTTIGVLAYYDVINFCRHISCPVRMTWGYNDNTCPPTTSYAAWNTLKCEKECFVTPINEHWTSDQMEMEHKEWIKARLK